MLSQREVHSHPFRRAYDPTLTGIMQTFSVFGLDF